MYVIFNSMFIALNRFVVSQIEASYYIVKLNKRANKRTYIYNP